MLINDLLNKLKDIENQEKELKQQKKDIIQQAKIDRVLEVNLIDLAYELSKTFKAKKCELYFNQIIIPNNINKDMNKAIEFIRSKNMGIGFGIILDNLTKFKFTMPVFEVRLNNGEDLINNLYFLGEARLWLNEDAQKRIMLNISLDNKNMGKDFFKEAVFKCVEKKEQENQQNL